MPIALKNTKPIDQNDFQFDPLLSQLQGNILKGHGRDHTANIFIEFDPAKLATVREWVHTFARERVTSAKRQLKENERFKRSRVSGGLFVGLYISAKGYEYFHVDDAKRPKDESFRKGMEAAPLNDPPVAQWEANFREITIHAMILLGDDDKRNLSMETAALVRELRPLTRAGNEDFVSPFIRIEHGNAIRNANGDGVEHFGYVDGVSQPLFFDDENRRFRAEATPSAGATLAWDPFAPLALVLVPDRGTTVPDACGSYFVFRKLEQQVRGFKAAEDKLATTLNLHDEARELAGALVVGRFEDGTPVTIDDEDGLIGSGNANNFNYAGDPAGLRCPFQAHIRKVNPRGSGITPGTTPAAVASDKTRVMARRGIPFGCRDVTTEIDSEPEQFPQGGVGLLFMSFQAKLAEQFEFIQTAWANNATFPLSNIGTPSGGGAPKTIATGVDPLIGQSSSATTATDRNYRWPVIYGTPLFTPPGAFEQFVQMRGGQYFFAPSIAGLTAL